MDDEAVIGLREAKARLSEVVARVRRGRPVTLTLRGRRVARIVALTDADRSLEDRLAELVLAGLVDPPAPAGARRRLPRPVRIRPAGRAQQCLQEDRG